MYEPGWYLRQDIIWAKPNPMPESVTDRCTKSHEYLFLLSKSARYFYDAEAIKEEAATDDLRRPYTSEGAWQLDGRPVEQRHGRELRSYTPPKGWDTSTGEGGHGAFHRLGREGANNRMHQDRDPSHSDERKVRTAGNKTHKTVAEYERSDSEEHRTAAGLLKIADTPYPMRNKRSVWEIATQPYSEAHFATFPEALVEPCILAGTKVGDTVLDPFCGSGTTGAVALRYQRDFIGIELNPAYAELAKKRIGAEAPMFNDVSVPDSATAYQT